MCVFFCFFFWKKKKFLRKWVCVTSIYCTIKNDHNHLNFFDRIFHFWYKNLNWTLNTLTVMTEAACGVLQCYIQSGNQPHHSAYFAFHAKKVKEILLKPADFSLLWRLVLTHYNLVSLFYTPWKHQKTSRLSDVFRRYRKAKSGCNGLTCPLSCQSFLHTKVVSSLHRQVEFLWHFFSEEST